MTPAESLVRDVHTLLWAGVTPEQADRARERLRTQANPVPTPQAVVRSLGARLPVQVPDQVEPATAAGAEAADMTVLVTGASMPWRLSAAWDGGGPLWVRHTGADVPDRPTVAIVGTRRPTLDGMRLAGRIAAGVAAAGVVVVSGLARGIDQAAHRGALQAGGVTTAVLGTGHGVDYPGGTGVLRRQIAASGGLLSEYAPGRGVRHPHQFVRRNRIIAGLADAVVLIEAGERSGALSTAGAAVGMGREVLVVPASPSNTAAAGALQLLGAGATPVRDAQDVLHLLKIDRPAAAVDTDPTPALPPAAAELLALLGPIPEPLGALAAAAGLSVRAVLVAVSELEDAGLARRHGDGVVRT